MSSLMEKRWFPPLALVLTLGLFGIWALATQTAIVPAGGDELLLQWWPYRLFLAASWRSFHFPLWSRNLLAGFPFAAFIHAGAFYPPNFFFCFFGYGTASTCFHLFHLWLQALFMYGFLREGGASKISSWLLAISSSLTGPFFFRMGVAHDFATLTWLPGIFWLGWRLTRMCRARDLFTCSLVIAFAFLAGNVEILFFTLIVLMVFLAVVGGTSPAKGVLLFLAVGLALLLVAHQFLLTTAFLPHSYRHFHPPAALNQSVRNLYLAMGLLIFLPSFPGSGEGFFAYLGLMLLLGLFMPAPESWLSRTRKLIVILGIPLLVYVLNPWPLSLVFNRLPFLGHFSSDDTRYRALFGLLLLCFLVSARGVDVLLSAPSRQALTRARAVLLFFLAAQLCWLVLGIMKGPGLPPFFISRLVLMFALILALWLKVPRPERPPRRLYAMPAGLVLLFFLDVFILAGLTLPRATRADLASLEANLDLPAELSPDRLHLASPVFNDRVLLRLFRLDRGPGLLVGYVRLGLNAFHETVFRMISADPQNASEDYNFFTPRFFSEKNWPLLNYLGVKFVVARGLPDLNRQGQLRLREEEPVQVFENPQALSRYGLYTAVRFYPEDQLALALFDPARFKPEQELLLPLSAARSDFSFSLPRERKPEDVRVLEYEQDHGRLRTTLALPSYLSMAEPYYHGWRAWVDGKEARIMRANYAFQALSLPTAGPHEITLRFVPVEFRLGLWIAISSLSALLFFGLTFFSRRREERKPVS